MFMEMMLQRMMTEMSEEKIKTQEKERPETEFVRETEEKAGQICRAETDLQRQQSDTQLEQLKNTEDADTEDWSQRLNLKGHGRLMNRYVNNKIEEKRNHKEKKKAQILDWNAQNRSDKESLNFTKKVWNRLKGKDKNI